MGNYIVLEGVKGVGKSTVFNMLVEYIGKKHIDFDIVCPTQKQDNSIWEYLNQCFSCDITKEKMYAHRSNMAATKAKWDSKIILGDRSIITSYATRFWDYLDPRVLINRVNILENNIKIPDIVLFLNANEDTIMNRLHSRKDRTYGKEDETISKIRKDKAAYDQLRNNVWPADINKAKWLDIDCNGNPEAIIDSIISLGLF